MGYKPVLDWLADILKELGLIPNSEMRRGGEKKEEEGGSIRVKDKNAFTKK